ncbi:putative Mn2+ efflux pump MntP [Natranaerovirga hydrolytica]|uniref:Putative manganese efflux pump MntP n=1 Tax=Natranaerovirga hydrolytica TaxID=680378 RepID=A0A4R1MM65_9FIRM|nr:manganese efflux pump [Natranaerovirga hydrolytica]TCK92364.1 putative Mn2+ efflux pump MntP [Natranaerovirga hydrolytica]
MNLLHLFLIALALASDAFAAALTIGLTNAFLIKKTVKVACFFGLSQGFMSILGWSFGSIFGTILEPIGHWIAFLLLTCIGINIMQNAKKNEKTIFSTDTSTIISISIATSIDAFATGIGFHLLHITITLPAIIIGLTTFVTSFLGVYMGKQLKKYIKKESFIYYISGLILIAMGVKILLDYL